jgi:hypothetical protein
MTARITAGGIMKSVLIVAGLAVLASLGVLAHPAQPPARVTPSAQAAPAAPAVPATPAAPATPVAPAAQAAPTAPPAPSAPAAKPPASFEQIKSLLGEWEGKMNDGKVARVTYKLVSSGTALMETMNPSDAEDMVTVYYPDGDRLMLTHYCASNNQPRMRTDAGSADPKQLVFNYVDATNLAGSREGVMTGLTVTFIDSDHFSQTWTWRDKVGGTPTSDTLEYSRKK